MLTVFISISKSFMTKCRQKVNSKYVNLVSHRLLLISRRHGSAKYLTLHQLRLIEAKRGEKKHFYLCEKSWNQPFSFTSRTHLLELGAESIIYLEIFFYGTIYIDVIDTCLIFLLVCRLIYTTRPNSSLARRNDNWKNCRIYTDVGK